MTGINNIEDIQQYLDANPKEASAFAAWLMVRAALDALKNEYSDDDAAALLGKMASFAPENVSLNAEVKMSIKELAA